MKSKFILIICVTWFFSFTHAQDTANKKPSRLGISYGSLSVKDSSGRSYKMEEWMPMVNSGRYALKQADGGDKNEFRLVTAPDSIVKAHPGPKPTESYYFKTGELFKNFATKDTGENTINTADLFGKILVLNFWFIDCPPCRSEIPSLNKLADLYKNDSSVVFIAVALDNKSRLKNFLRDNPFDYKMIYNGRSIAAQYGIVLYPTSVVVDQKGTISFHTTGATNNLTDWIKKTIEDLKSKKQ